LRNSAELGPKKLERSRDKGMIIIAMFLDLKRAFETIDRKILLQKLHHYGVTKKELSKRSVPKNRFQGVPQGSVLGPILFVLYINDIVLAVHHSTVNLFADDTLLSIVGNNVEECLTKMNEDLATLAEWLNFNKLKLNVDKTKYMIITSRRTEAASNSNLKIYAEVIQRVKTMKYSWASRSTKS
jgi:Reverse transcriptase (RNA-dependent DNA polymerase)